MVSAVLPCKSPATVDPQSPAPVPLSLHASALGAGLGANSSVDSAAAELLLPALPPLVWSLVARAALHAEGRTPSAWAWLRLVDTTWQHALSSTRSIRLPRIQHHLSMLPASV